MKCRKCNHDCPEDANFCPSCGEALLNTCPKCGKQVSNDSLFCPSCGCNLVSKDKNSSEIYVNLCSPIEKNKILPAIFIISSIVVLIMGFWTVAKNNDGHLINLFIVAFLLLSYVGFFLCDCPKTKKIVFMSIETGLGIIIYGYCTCAVGQYWDWEDLSRYVCYAVPFFVIAYVLYLFILSVVPPKGKNPFDNLIATTNDMKQKKKKYPKIIWNLVIDERSYDYAFFISYIYLPFSILLNVEFLVFISADFDLSYLDINSGFLITFLVIRLVFHVFEIQGLFRFSSFSWGSQLIYGYSLIACLLIFAINLANKGGYKYTIYALVVMAITVFNLIYFGVRSDSFHQNHVSQIDKKIL